ncbi:TraR/DksA C4-type zinc finger protein [Micromonospora sp. WMMD980]|uniref:TraR/DksA family transcriptional regulator n=1 Tax=Micromonospora sp. WMMD980 TaxID=3016088 RepID=UPI002417C5AC|nr:TraR/DksA C4-type zinc finger protein [Micromonospora sp. WMMD980]MDG4801988.1 TraR/DksA C4-type zinc finger protein [Micromonospora sp. WMMD980]
MDGIRLRAAATRASSPRRVRAQLTALLAGARQRVADLDDALRRVDTATYGLCERCGQPIGAERLAARPFARFCMACA